MNEPVANECPHRSILESLGTLDRNDQEQESLELHVESCAHCQSVLQTVASSGRLDLSAVLSSSGRLPDVAPELPGFRIERELGRGGGSVVYLAEDLSTSRQVALKLIPGGWTQGSRLRSAWLDEVRVAARMQHQNIVRLYRVEETLHWFLLVFEYIPGGTLRDRLHLPIEPLQLAALMQTLARAVEQIHQTGVLHLDLKPSNVLVDDSQGSAWPQIIPRISDFGVSMWSDAEWDSADASTGRSAQQIRGTPSYMSPEQVLGDPDQLSPATDVYGLGGILYTLLTGALPFKGTTTDSILRQVLEARVIPPRQFRPDLPAELVAICLRCLEKRPVDRYATPMQLAAAISRWIDGQHQRRVSGTQKRRQWRLPVSAISAAAVIAAAFLLMNSALQSGRSLSDTARTAIVVAGGQHGVEPIHESAEPALSPAEWVNEIAEEPEAFDIDRAERLVDATSRHTDDILRAEPPQVDQWLEFGILQQRAAERFAASTRVELYPAADSILHDSVRLLERFVQTRPDDQTALLELVAARYSKSQLRIRLHQHPSGQLSQHELSCASCLLPAAAQALHIKDLKQRVHWLGMILDQYRCIASMAGWQNDEATANMLKAWELQCWSMIGDEQQIPDLAVRHALMHAGPDQNHWPSLPDQGWVVQENREILGREVVFHLLAEALFAAAEKTNGQLGTNAHWSAEIDLARTYMQQQKISTATLPRIVHYELIRPVATVSTICRLESQMERADSLQQTYRELCETCKTIFPDNVDIHLAASEAQLQAWKNEIRRGHRDAAISALRASLQEAENALRVSPDSSRARFQVADRIRRLTRIQSPG